MFKLDVDQMVLQLNVAKAALGESRGESFAVQWSLVRGWADRVIAGHLADGFTAFEAKLGAWKARLRPDATPADWAGYVRSLVCHARDVTPVFLKHIRDAVAAGAACFFVFSGAPGYGKSSTAVRLLRAMGCFEGAPLADRIAFDDGEFLKKFGRAKPGQGLLKDEDLIPSGEGSRTREINRVNLENTQRATMVHVIICSPAPLEHVVAQVELRAFLFNREAQQTRFMMYVDGEEQGCVTLKWSEASDWAEYSAVKDVSNARTRKLQFRPQAALFETVMSFFEDERLVKLLDSMNRLQKSEMREAFRFLFADSPSLTAQQLPRAADAAVGLLQMYPRFEPAKWESVFGSAAPPEFVRLADKFFSENVVVDA